MDSSLISHHAIMKAQKKAAKDPRVLRLAAALNSIPGIQVDLVGGCARHESLTVFFRAQDLRWLYIIGRAVDRNYGGYGFRCELSTTDLPEKAVGFMLVTDTDDLRGPPLKGEHALAAADQLADRIEELMSPAALHVRKLFNLE